MNLNKVKKIKIYLEGTLEPKQALSSAFLYYTFLTERCLTYCAIDTSFLILNVYYPTISNENNRNWNKVLREERIGTLTSIFYLGCVIGALISGMFVSLNTKHVYSFFKVALGFSMIPFVIGDYSWMIISRFLQGLFGEVSHVIIMWSVYEITLSEHKAMIYPMLYSSCGFSGLVYTQLSLYDDGGSVFWKWVFFSPVVLLWATVVLDYTVVRHVNTFTYLLKQKGEIETYNTIVNYYDDDTAKLLIKKYQRNFELEDSIYVDDSESIFGPIINFFKAVKKFRFEAFHIIMVASCGLLGYSEAYTEFSVYIGAKSMKDKVEVKKAQKSVIIYSIGKIFITIFVACFKLIKFRKVSMLICHGICQLSLILICYGYFTENLFFARLGVIIATIFGVVIFSIIYLYANDICPPSIFAVTGFTKRIMGGIFGVVFPWILKFETNSFYEIGVRLLGFLVVGLIGFFTLWIWMYESFGLSKTMVYERLRGIKRNDNESFPLVQDGEKE